MAEWASELLIALLGVSVLLYPFRHLRGILNAHPEYTTWRIIFLSAWMFTAAVIILEFAALFTISLY